MALTRITDKQGATGSVVRGLGDKLRESVSVKAGNMTVRFAQLTADATNTNILAGSTLTVFGDLE